MSILANHFNHGGDQEDFIFNKKYDYRRLCLKCDYECEHDTDYRESDEIGTYCGICGYDTTIEDRAEEADRLYDSFREML